MPNKKILSIFIFLHVFSVSLFINLSSQTNSIDDEDEEWSVFSKKPKPPILSPEKRGTFNNPLPSMELISEPVKQEGAEKAQDQVMPQMNLIQEKSTDSDEQESSRASQSSNHKKHNDNKKSKAEVEEKTKEQSPNKRITFNVENVTGKTVYIACFAYIKKRAEGRWRWQKSPIFKLDDNQKRDISTDEIEDDEDRDGTFGYLGVFDTLEAAEESTFELLPDKQKIDLDLLIQLKDKTVRIEIEKYGFLGTFYDYDFVKIKEKQSQNTPELDFEVENKTGKTILATCFVYQKKAKSAWLAKKTSESWTDIGETRDDLSVWRFDKTPVITIKPNETGKIDVDTIIEPRDREYVRGYLVLFDEDEQKQAEEATYELLPENTKKLDLGRLINLKNKKIRVYTEKYGTSDFIDYTVQPAKRIDLSKITSKIG